MNRKSVLIVDDEPLARGLLRRGLEAAGFAVTDAADGAGALAAIKRERFDAAVLDFVLPDTDGPAIAAALRASATDPSMPIIGVSGYLVDRASLPAGLFNHVLAKPFDIKTLVEVIEAYVPRSRVRARK